MSTPASPTKKPHFPILVSVLAVTVLAAVATGVYLFTRPGPREEGPPIEPIPVSGRDGPVVFEDVTSGTGIDFTYHNGEETDHYTILESLGGGVALFDYDGDGRLDIFFTGGGSFEGSSPVRVKGQPGRLYRNLGGWKFADVTAAAGLDGPVFYSHGAHAADYDCDGFVDLLVTGWGRVALYHNEPDGKGGRRFAEVAARAGLTDSRWSTSAAWGDLDADGFPDLYICYYLDWSPDNDPTCQGAGLQVPRDVCAPERFQPLQDRLYRNTGHATFEDVTAKAPLRKDGKGLGVLFVDVDADDRPDIYVGNDAGDNFLYLNRGGMKFEEKGVPSGVALDDNGMYDGSMGVDAADFDGSGRPSLWVANFQSEFHALYLNLGGGRFRYYSQAAGIGRLGQRFVGFGTRFLDYDLDGWEDLAIVNGHVLRHPVGSTMAQRAVLLHNEEHEGRRQFREQSGWAGQFSRDLHHGRGLAVGDLDNDGWPDLVVSRQNQPVALLRNIAGTTAGKGNGWLGVDLARKDRRDLVGTTITLACNGRKLTRFVKGGGSYLSTSDSRILLGLGRSTTAGRLTVRWPGGHEQHFDGLAAGRYWRIMEGRETPEPAGQ